MCNPEMMSAVAQRAQAATAGPRNQMMEVGKGLQENVAIPASDAAAEAIRPFVGGDYWDYSKPGYAIPRSPANRAAHPVFEGVNNLGHLFTRFGAGPQPYGQQ